MELKKETMYKRNETVHSVQHCGLETGRVIHTIFSFRSAPLRGSSSLSIKKKKREYTINLALFIPFSLLHVCEG
jgi:hypothetical protein